MASKYSEIVIGYSARSAKISEYNKKYSNRKSLFHLRDTRQTLSLDTAIWLQVGDEIRSSYGLSRLVEKVRELDIPVWIVGVTRIAVNEVEKAEILDSYNSLTEPKSVGDTWLFLGYDIIETQYPYVTSFLSGLSNLSYEEKEHKTLQEQYGPYLNQYHLFTDIDTAVEFAEGCDARDPGHGPFSVFGVYLIPMPVR